MIHNLLRGIAEMFRTAPTATHPGTPSDPFAVLAIVSLERDRQALRRIASTARWKLTLTESCEEAIEVLGRNRRVPVILCDRDLPGLSWQQALDHLLTKAPGSCAVLTSPVNDEYLWSEVIRRGGYDVLTTPFEEEAVNRSIHRAWSYWKIGWTHAPSRNAGS